MRFLIVWFALLAAACGDRQAASRDTTRHSVAALRPVTTDTSPKDVEEVDLGTPQFPISRLLSSLATGAPQAALTVADESCIPGKCRCSGTFPLEWHLEHASIRDTEMSACTVADFDGDGDWDASLPGGEGKSVMILMQDARPYAAWYVDGGAVAELYAPRAQRGPNGEPAAKYYALRAYNSLYEWRDSMFARRIFPAR